MKKIAILPLPVRRLWRYPMRDPERCPCATFGDTQCATPSDARARPLAIPNARPRAMPNASSLAKAQGYMRGYTRGYVRRGACSQSYTRGKPATHASNLSWSPSISKSLWWLVSPRLISIALLGRPRLLARSLHTAAFAFPLSGGAVTRRQTSMAPSISWTPMTWSLPDFGVTFTARFAAIASPIRLLPRRPHRTEEGKRAQERQTKSDRVSLTSAGAPNEIRLHLFREHYKP